MVWIWGRASSRAGWTADGWLQQEANPKISGSAAELGRACPLFYLDTWLDYISQTPLLPGIAMY